MASLARVVAPGLPHHVTQRGNRRQTVFFSDDDYAAYKALLAEHCAATGWSARRRPSCWPAAGRRKARTEAARAGGCARVKYCVPVILQGAAQELSIVSP
jgi:hypothetical protein